LVIKIQTLSLDPEHLKRARTKWSGCFRTGAITIWVS